ncbi:MAG TPA: MFS transporter [Polyangiaceae bacterium]
MAAGTPRSAKWTLVVAVLGSTMVFLDGTVVNVALPVMQRSLGASLSSMQWVVEAYALFLASLVLVGGALGDRLGRRRVFVAGVAIFALASALCGLAPNATLLVVARSVQGIGGALLVPGSLALISAAYDEDSRGGAIGAWSATTSIMAALGPLFGGWLVTFASWRWLFFLNVPLGLATSLFALLHVEETHDEEATGVIDWAGASLVTLGLGLVVLALLEAPALGGIGDARTLGILASGAVVIGAFVAVEAKKHEPMVKLSLFRSHTFSGANALTLLLYAALGGALFFLPFDLIQVQGYSAAQAGASLLPMIVLISALSPFMGRFVDRFGVRVPLVVGPLLAGAGFGLLARAGVGGRYVSEVLPGVVVLGLGMGVTVAPLTTAVMGSVSNHHAGVASGINNAVSRAASVLAVAALGVALTTRFDDVLRRELGARGIDESARTYVESHRDELAGIDLSRFDDATRSAIRGVLNEAYVAGFRVLMLACAILAVIGAGLALLLIDAKSVEKKAGS